MNLLSADCISCSASEGLKGITEAHVCIYFHMNNSQMLTLNKLVNLVSRDGKCSCMCTKKKTYLKYFLQKYTS